jgi:acetylglutamate kinase
MDPELGAVGRVVRSDPALLHLLTGNGYLPVVACVAGDSGGKLYNVNADQMAVACAASFAADQLIFLTDVDGVMDGAKQIRPQLTIASCQELISSGVATGGMQAKLNAATSALRQGVKQVRIANGSAPDVLPRLLGGETLGTRLVP